MPQCAECCAGLGGRRSGLRCGPGFSGCWRSSRGVGASGRFLVLLIAALLAGQGCGSLAWQARGCRVPHASPMSPALSDRLVGAVPDAVQASLSGGDGAMSGRRRAARRACRRHRVQSGQPARCWRLGAARRPVPPSGPPPLLPSAHIAAVVRKMPSVRRLADASTRLSTAACGDWNKPRNLRRAGAQSSGSARVGAACANAWVQTSGRAIPANACAGRCQWQLVVLMA